MPPSHQMNKRILAIDYGSKRVGLAVTDPLQIIASPLETVPRHQLMTFLKNYLATEPVECFVMGLPVKLDNSPGDIYHLVMQFKGQLEKGFPDIPVHLIDERFTSKMAQDAMIRGGMKKKDRQDKTNVDRISAAILLQSFMESRA